MHCRAVYVSNDFSSLAKRAAVKLPEQHVHLPSWEAILKLKRGLTMLNWNCVPPKALTIALTLTLISGGVTPLRASGRKGSTKNPNTAVANGGPNTVAGTETETETENEANDANETGGGNGGGGTTASGKNGGTSGKNGGGGGGTETRLRAKGLGTGTAGAAPELSGDFRVKGTETRLKGEAENLSGLAVGSQVTFCLNDTTLLATSLVETEAGVNVAEFDLESKKGATTIPPVAAGNTLSAFSGGTCGGGPLIALATFQ
jgi:hypothetical protein